MGSSKTIGRPHLAKDQVRSREEAEQGKRKSRREIDALVDAKKQELLTMINDQKIAFQNQFEAREKIVQAKLEVVNAKIRKDRTRSGSRGREKLISRCRKGNRS